MQGIQKAQPGSDESMLASASWDRTVKLWDVKSLHLRETLTGRTDRVHGVTWSPNGRILASCGDDNDIHVWDLENGERLQSLRPDHPYERLDISGVKGLTEAQRASLRSLGAVEEATTSLSEER